MGVKKIEIPTFDEAAAAIDHGKATPLDEFIYEHEPTNKEGAPGWRARLARVVEWVQKESGTK